MKTKGKKADKKKANLKKTAETRLVDAPIILANADPSERIIEAAPIEVLPEVTPQASAVVAPTVQERRAMTPEERRRLISMAAYYRAQRVGFGKTNPIEDWLLAEREIDAMIASGVWADARQRRPEAPTVQTGAST